MDFQPPYSLALRPLCSHPPHPKYALLGFRVLEENPGVGPLDPSLSGQEWEGAYNVIAPTTQGEEEELARCMQLPIAMARLG